METCVLTLSPPITTIVPNANSFDVDEMPNYVSSRSKLFDTQTTFSPILIDIESL